MSFKFPRFTNLVDLKSGQGYVIIYTSFCDMQLTIHVLTYAQNCD